MDSVWTKTAQLPSFQPLREDIKADVLIIGGGLAGLLCAHRLAQAGVDYALVEADTICSGITKNTTAKITSQHGLIYDELIRKIGMEKARLYLEANQHAIRQYSHLCRHIECDFAQQDAFVYSLDDRRKIDRELEALLRLNFDATFEKDLPLPFPVAGAVRFAHQAQFHPLKFVAGLAKNLRIYEHTKVRQLMPGKAVTSSGTITADRIIIATHFPLLNKHGGYFIKLYQHRSYVLALKKAPVFEGMYLDENEKGLSFRHDQDMLLLGGGSHRTGKQGGNWQELEQFAKQHYPRAEIDARWATQDCMTLDGIPYIGQYAKHTPHLLVATGFNKWGITSSMVAANILSDLVQGKQNPYADVFNPSRSILHPQLFLNAAETTLNLLTPTIPRCPHMGCALQYNKAEHSWDCPCHGSRFSKNGALIDNPATDDKRM
ncbi:MAG: FAD-dependent oxidoreductase [Clostridiales bacterium]|nr:FAD-dependent oxidoreductase [Clostridiales bacterium]